MAAPPRDIYLAEGFNPTKLTMPQLRSILLEHNIHHLSSAKKADLVHLFATRVAPQGAQILAADARVLPSAHGIIAVSNNGDEAPVDPGQTAAGVKRPRKKTAKSAATDVDEPVAEPAPKKARSRKSTAEPEAVPKKPRKSTKKAPDVEVVVDTVETVVAGPSSDAPAPIPTPARAPRRKSRAPSSSVEPPTPSKRKSTAKAPRLPTPPKMEPVVEVPSPVRRVAPPAPRPGTSSDADSPRHKPRISIDDDEDTFSDFNPFQAGSTQAAQAERRRRKSSLGLTEGKRRAPRPSEWTATSVPAAAVPAAALPAANLVAPTPILRRVSPNNEDLRIPRTPPSEARIRQDVTWGDEHNRVIEEKMGRKKEARKEDATDAPAVAEQPKPAPNALAGQRGTGKAIVRRKKKDPAPSPLSIGLGLLLFLLAGYYKSLSSANGFCDPGSTTNDVIQGREVPIANAQACIHRSVNWPAEHDGEVAPFECDKTALPLVPFFPRPTDCTPCPPHATCANGQVTQCAPEYILTSNLLAPLGPLVDGWPGLPTRIFPPYCRPDTARMRQVGQLARQIEAELAAARGNLVCSRESESSDKGLGEKYGKLEATLRESFAERRVASVTREQFDELFDSALQDLVEHGDVIESIDVDGQSWYAAARTEFTLACRAKLEAQSLLDQWKSQLFMTAGVVGAILMFKHQIENTVAERKRAKELTRVVLKRLQDQEQLHYVDASITPQPYLPPAQLRDVVLPASDSAATRARIWALVEAAIEKNANVSVSEREVRGDMWKTWEWTGVGERRVEY